MADDRPKLHPVEHRAYRELYAASRQLIHRWQRLSPALAETPVGAVLEHGVEETERLLVALEPRTAAYDLHGGPMAQSAVTQLVVSFEFVSLNTRDTRPSSTIARPPRVPT